MRLESSILTPVTLDQTWSFLASPVQTSPLWDRSVAEVIPDSDGPVGVGWTATTVAPSGNRQRFEVTRFDPGRELAFNLLESSMFRSAELTFVVAAAPDGTWIHHVIDLRLRNFILWPILRLIQRRALARDLRDLRSALARTYLG